MRWSNHAGAAAVPCAVAKAAKRKLKVFVAHIGFYEAAVAVTSKKAALEAFGTRQDLFKEGLAGESSEAAAAAALEHPGQVLRRPAGSKGAFELRPATPRAAKATARPSKPPDRAPVERLERRVAKLDEGHAADLRALQAEADKLAARRAAIEKRHAKAHAELEKQLEAALAAWRAAGGR
ncbi:MAG TPA: hypothetical protein VGS12_04085 [Caulobacteraceae bacterium]|nr:hypothetical protein [Caulobacteraceae bacterium]